MKPGIRASIFQFLLLGFCTCSFLSVSYVKGVSEEVKNIHWLGHDSFRIEGEGLTIYTDPWQLGGGPAADIILITHEHPDHCSREDVAKISKKDTVIVTTADAAKNLSGDIRIVRPGDTLEVRSVRITAVPAYNVNKFRSPGVPFHPKESGKVGFVFKLGNTVYYHAGDTDFIEEMKSIRANTVFLPVSGIYVMTVDEAVQAAKVLAPELVIPMHVGRGIGSLEDLDRFKKKAEKENIKVQVLQLEKQ